MEASRRTPAVPLEHRVIDLGQKPPIECQTCQDFGIYVDDKRHHHWCRCIQAKRQKFKKKPIS